MPTWSGWGTTGNYIEEAIQRRQAELRAEEAAQEAARRQQTVIDSIYAQRPEPQQFVPDNETTRYQQYETLWNPASVDTGTPPLSSSGPPPDTVSSQHRGRPAPVYIAPTNPVQDLKRRTAIKYQLTPEATVDLYNTPTQVSYAPGDPRPNTEGLLGTYRGQPAPIGGGATSGEMWVWGPSAYNNPEQTMMHEFAHKRYYENGLIPRKDWEWTARDAMTPGALPTYEALYGPRQEWNSPHEAYSYQAQAPWEMSPDMRERYYPGIWQQDISAPPPPPRPQYFETDFSMFRAGG